MKIPEEGDTCPWCLQGTMGYEPVKECNCLNSPPCSRCVDNPLVCLKCGIDAEQASFIADTGS